jgi:hypothetical protein
LYVTTCANEKSKHGIINESFANNVVKSIFVSLITDLSFGYSHTNGKIYFILSFEFVPIDLTMQT